MNNHHHFYSSPQYYGGGYGHTRQSSSTNTNRVDLSRATRISQLKCLYFAQMARRNFLGR